MGAEGQANDRLAAIESLLSHVQYDVDKLNEALISQQAEIDGLVREHRKLQSAIDQLSDPPDDPREERPPHY